jgi:hypothetical protein
MKILQRRSSDNAMFNSWRVIIIYTSSCRKYKETYFILYRKYGSLYFRMEEIQNSNSLKIHHIATVWKFNTHAFSLIKKINKSKIVQEHSFWMQFYIVILKENCNKEIKNNFLGPISTIYWIGVKWFSQNQRCQNTLKQINIFWK